MNCSIPGDYPFYYDEIQSVSFVPEAETVYAAFSTGETGIRGSAVCGFNLSAVETAFEGPFKTRPGPDSVWGPKKDDHEHFRCEDPNRTQQLPANSKEYQLMDRAVQQVTHEPVFRVRSCLFNFSGECAC